MKVKVRGDLATYTSRTIREYMKKGNVILFMTDSTWNRITRRLSEVVNIPPYAGGFTIFSKMPFSGNVTKQRDGVLIIIPQQKWAKVTKKKKNRLFGVVYNNNAGEFFIGDPSAPDNTNNKLKTGRLFKALFSGTTDEEIENLVNLWSMYYHIDANEFKITKDVADVYNMLHASVSSIGGSCMKNNGEYYEDLACNTNVSILYYTKGGRLQGRALLWEKVTLEGEEIKFMDRIYSSSPVIEKAFKEWAKTNGYYHKREQSYNAPLTFVSPEGEEVTGIAYTPAHNVLDWNYFPYLDTFKYVTEECLTNDENIEGLIGEATNTNGSIEDDRITCDYCEDRCPEDEINYIDYLDIHVCSDCLNEYFTWSDYHDGYIRYDDAVYVEDYETYIRDTYVIYDDVHDYYVCEDNNDTFYTNKGTLTTYGLEGLEEDYIEVENILSNEHIEYDIIIGEETDNYILSDYFQAYIKADFSEYLHFLPEDDYEEALKSDADILPEEIKEEIMTKIKEKEETE